jgi:hypothetical protein
MHVLWLLLIGLLAGCQSLYPYDETRHYFSVPSGSNLILNRPLRTAPGELAIYLQDGVPYTAAPNRMQPYCKFELRHKREQAQRIEPDRFVIERATRHWSTGLEPDWRLRPAIRLLLDDGGPTFLVFSSFFFLRSDQQPEVLRMTCEYWGDPATGRFLSIEQIRQTLGEVFTLELNGPARLL